MSLRLRAAKQNRSFLGVVTEYRDKFPCRSYILGPHTALTRSGLVVCWCQFINTFADVPAHQLGSVLIQKGSPIDSYFRLPQIITQL